MFFQRYGRALSHIRTAKRHDAYFSFLASFECARFQCKVYGGGITATYASNSTGFLERASKLTTSAEESLVSSDVIWICTSVPVPLAAATAKEAFEKRQRTERHDCPSSERIEPPTAILPQQHVLKRQGSVLQASHWNRDGGVHLSRHNQPVHVGH